MNPEDFLKTIYLGDRACKAILIDTWRKRVSIQANLISRIKPGASTWDYYDGGDIDNGWLVFTGVKDFIFDPPGLLPNDFINGISIMAKTQVGNNLLYLFDISISAGDDSGSSREVIIHISATDIHLEDPLNPGLEIR